MLSISSRLFSTTSKQALPIINGYKLKKKDKYEINRLMKAATSVGFFYLTKFDGAEHLQSIVEAGRQFFDLSQDLKDSIHFHKSTGLRGYSQLYSEKTLGVADAKESLDIGFMPRKTLSTLNSLKEEPPSWSTLICENQWPEGCKWTNQWKNFIESYMGTLMNGAGRDVLDCISIGFNNNNNNNNHFAEWFDNTASDYFSLLRMNHYPNPHSILNDFKKPVIGIGEHTDFGFLTLLALSSNSSGLQVKNRDGNWIDVEPLKDCIVVNIADMLESWTCGYLKSTPHRVILDPARISVDDPPRVSIPFFLEPRLSTPIRQTILTQRQRQKEMMVQETKIEPNFGDAVTYGDHYLNALKRSYPDHPKFVV